MIKKARSNYWPSLLAGLLLGCLICTGCWVWFWLNNPQTLPFREVRLVGHFQHINSTQLPKQIQQKLQGGFFAVKLAPIKKDLMLLPWVEDVSIRRTPAVLIVTIQEQQALAHWNQNSLLNDQGQLFIVPNDEIPQGLPLLQGPETTEALVLANYLRLNAIFKPLNLQVQGLKLSLRQSWELTFNNGIEVTLGRDDILAKAQRLAKWYPTLVGTKADQIKHLDLRYQNGIAIEWKNK